MSTTTARAEKSPELRALIFERSGCPEGWCCRKEPRHTDKHNPHLVPADVAYVADAQAALDRKDGPHVGDWVRYADGTMTRIAYDWGPEIGKIQTCGGGSFHMGRQGWVEMSGSLHSAIPRALVDTGEKLRGGVWLFHRDRGGAGRGVNATALFRVYATSERSPRP